MNSGNFLTNHQPFAGLALLLFCSAALAQTPDTFTWVAGNDSWNVSSNWTSLLNDHLTPGIAGDMVNTTVNPATIMLNANITIAGLTNSKNVNINPDATGLSLTLETTDGTASKITNTADTLTLGLDATQLDLVISNPLTIATTGGGVYCRTRITGGTTTSPRDINLSGGGTVYFTNPNNNFYGTINLASGAKLFLGRTGYARDSMLGAATNKIVLNNASLYLWADGSTLINRHIQGAGVVDARTIDSYNNSFNQALKFDAGTLLAPSTATGAGEIRLVGSSVTMNANTTARLDFFSGSNDKISVSHYQGSMDTYNKKVGEVFSWTGRIELVEVAPDIPVGAQFTIMKVENVKAFNFNPSFKTRGYSYAIQGSAAPWTVVATKLDAGPAVLNHPASDVDETQAWVAAEAVVLDPDDSAVLRVYYGETDGYATPSDWSYCAIYPTIVTTLDKQTLLLNSNLQVNKTYYYRHSISNSAGEKFSSNVNTFTTRPHTTPDAFIWTGTSANWFDEGIWTITTPYLRKHPQYVGDKITYNVGGVWPNNGVSRTSFLTHDVIVSDISVVEGRGSFVKLTAANPEQPVTLTLDSLGASAAFTSNGELSELYFGASLTDPMTVTFNKPMSFTWNSAYSHTAFMYATLTGGSLAAPSDMTIAASGGGGGDTHVYFYLLNTNNTFRGDFYIGTTYSHQSTTELRIGQSVTHPSEDAIFGHPDNKIHLRNAASLRLYALATGCVALCREVFGLGTIYSSAGLALDASATLAPHAINSETGFGTITVSATAFSDDPGTQYLIKVADAEGANDKLVFNVTGDVAINGKLVFAPTVQKIPLGLTWEIMTISKPAAATFTHSLKGSNGFAVTVEESDPAKIIVRATSIAYSTLLMVR